MDKAQKSKKNMLVKLLAFLGTAVNAAIFAGWEEFDVWGELCGLCYEEYCADDCAGEEDCCGYWVDGDLIFID